MGLKPLLAVVLLPPLVVNLVGGGLPLGPAAAAAAEPAAPAPSWLARHRQPLLVAASAGAAGAGLTAALYRRAANDRFEDYQRTADPERLAALYDETTRLDNRAAGFFIAAEAAFIFAMVLGFFVHAPHDAASGNAAALHPSLVAGRGVALRWDF
jgi:hypothetical protein